MENGAILMRLGYIEYAGLDHDLSEEAWRQAVEQMIAWFQRFLNKNISLPS